MVLIKAQLYCQYQSCIGRMDIEKSRGVPPRPPADPLIQFTYFFLKRESNAIRMKYLTISPPASVRNQMVMVRNGCSYSKRKFFIASRSIMMVFSMVFHHLPWNILSTWCQKHSFDGTNLVWAFAGETMETWVSTINYKWQILSKEGQKSPSLSHFLDTVSWKLVTKPFVIKRS